MEEPLKSRLDLSFAKRSVLAGSCAGVASTLAMHPMDVIRTKMQTSTGQAGPLLVARQTIRDHGICGLYRGIGMPLMAQAVYKATVFSVNNLVSGALVKHRSKASENDLNQISLSYADRFFCGSVAGMVNAGIFVTPVEFVRNQLILSQRGGVGYKSSVSVIYTWVREHGVFSLWHGARWAVSRDALGCGCFFAAMNMAQDRLDLQPTWLNTAAAGGVAGLSFWLVGLPLDALKTLAQSRKANEAPVRVLKVVFQSGHNWTEGISRLFRGWQVAYGRGVPSAVITISVYTAAFNLLNDY